VGFLFDDNIADALTVYALTHDLKNKNTIDIFNQLVVTTKVNIPGDQVLSVLEYIEAAKNKIELSSYILLAQLGGMIPRALDYLKVKKAE
jgi:hypothetical protein